MLRDYKKHKAELIHPPTGGGPLPARKTFIHEMDKYFASDSRGVGIVGGLDLG